VERLDGRVLPGVFRLYLFLSFLPGEQRDGCVAGEYRHSPEDSLRALGASLRKPDRKAKAKDEVEGEKGPVIGRPLPSCPQPEP